MARAADDGGVGAWNGVGQLVGQGHVLVIVLTGYHQGGAGYIAELGVKRQLRAPAESAQRLCQLPGLVWGNRAGGP